MRALKQLSWHCGFCCLLDCHRHCGQCSQGSGRTLESEDNAIDRLGIFWQLIVK